MKTTFSKERYERQLVLKNFGEAGQQKLFESKVLMIGAGGLGCSALVYLAAAGVGTIGIVDHDMVSLSNLHRQILYRTDDIGAYKSERAAAYLRGLNPEITINSHQEKLRPFNAIELISQYDMVIDGTDNFATKYLINDACVLLHKALVFGAISQYEGQVAIFNHKKLEQDELVNYRDVFPSPSSADKAVNCSIDGVLGVLPGIIGSMLANETIKLITGIGEALVNQLFTYNALNNSTYQISLKARKEGHATMPKDKKSLMEMDYEFYCSTRLEENEIDLPEFKKLLLGSNVEIVDVREKDETPFITEFACRQLPLTTLVKNASLIQSETVILVCQTGKRSSEAALLLKSIFKDSKKIVSLSGGITAYKNSKEKGVHEKG